MFVMYVAVVGIADRQGQTYSATVLVQNAGRVSKKLKLVQPASDVSPTLHRHRSQYASYRPQDFNVFVLGPSAEQWMLAPGMVWHALFVVSSQSLSLRLEYLCDGLKDFKDTVRFAAQDEVALEIPVEVRLPVSLVEYPSTIDFGVLVNDGRTNTRRVVLRNRGRKSCGYRLALEPVGPFKLRSEEGVLPGVGPADVAASVELDFVTTMAGTYSAAITVYVDERVHGKIVLQAQVADQALAFLAPDGTTAINHIDLGCTHYNTSRTVAAVLHNSGHTPADFVFSTDEQRVFAHVGGGRVADTVEAVCVTVSPPQGTLLPHEKRTVELTFSPQHQQPAAGWRAQVCFLLALWSCLELPLSYHAVNGSSPARF